MVDVAGALLWQAANGWQRAAQAALLPRKLTYVQALLLMALADRIADGAATTQVELARHARADVMMTSQILRVLERRRLVTRSNVEGDARARRVLLTPAGEAAVAGARAALADAMDSFFAPLGADRGAFAAALGRLIGVRVRLRVPSTSTALENVRA